MNKAEMEERLQQMFIKNSILISRNDALEKELEDLKKENAKLKQNHQEKKEKK